MNKIFAKIAFAALFVFGLMITAPARAADKPSDDLWAQRCAEVKQGDEKEKTKHCEVFQRLSMKATKENPKPQRVAEFAIGYMKDKGAKTSHAQAVLVLPLGIVLDAPMKISIDGKDQMTFHVMYCQPDGCYAFMPLTPDFLTKMGKSEKIAFTVRAMTGQNLQIEMMLTGFSKAHEKIKP